MTVIRFVVGFVATASACVFVMLLVLGSIETVRIQEQARSVVVRDALGQRVHKLSGMVIVPTACHELASRAKEIDDANYLLAFNTWENPNRICNSEEVARQFNLTIFAPSTGIAFQATLDDVSIPLTVIPAIE